MDASAIWTSKRLPVAGSKGECAGRLKVGGESVIYPGEVDSNLPSGAPGVPHKRI